MTVVRTRIDSRLNLRDLGGLPTADGRAVNAGLVFRSAQLRDMADDEAPVVGRLGIRTVLDLRTAHERTARPGPELPGAEHQWLDVLGEDAEAGPARLEEMLRSPARARDQLGDGRADAVFRRTYRDFVSAPCARTAYGRLVRTVADSDAAPVLFHCTAGKDRTGWAAAVLLTALGVPRETVVADYLESNDTYLAAHRAIIDRYARAGGDPDVLLAVMSARRVYLESAFDEVESVYGGFEGYLIDGLGLDADIICRLRSRLLPPA